MQYKLTRFNQPRGHALIYMEFKLFSRCEFRLSQVQWMQPEWRHGVRQNNINNVANSIDGTRLPDELRCNGVDVLVIVQYSYTVRICFVH